MATTPVSNERDYIIVINCLLIKQKNAKLSHLFRFGPENRHFLVHFSNKKMKNCPTTTTIKAVGLYRDPLAREQV